MPYRKTPNLELSGPARDDIEDIAHYTYLKYGEAQVDVYLQILNGRMALIAQDPTIGHRRDDLPKHYRALQAGKHVIVYRTINNTINVARILHGSMDFKKHIDLSS